MINQIETMTIYWHNIPTIEVIHAHIVSWFPVLPSMTKEELSGIFTCFPSIDCLSVYVVTQFPTGRKCNELGYLLVSS